MTKHALARNVEILALPPPVELMLLAKLDAIAPLVFACQVMRVTHIEFAKNVSMRITILLFSLDPILYAMLPLAGCKNDNECPLSKACIFPQRECEDPCRYEKCGTRATCSTRNHLAMCKCDPGTKGNPYRECIPYECLVHDDCPTTLACVGEKCVDPCNCAANADCEARNHQGQCRCILDYIGDPNLPGPGCEPSRTQISLVIHLSLLFN